MTAPSDPRIHFDFRILAERLYTAVALGTIVALLVHLITDSGPALVTDWFSQSWWRELAQLLLAVWTITYAFGSYLILKTPGELAYDGRYFAADCAECAALAIIWIFLGVFSGVTVQTSMLFTERMAGALAAITLIAVLRMFVRRVRVVGKDELVAAVRLDSALVSGLGALLLWQLPDLAPPENSANTGSDLAATSIAVMCAAYLCLQLGLYYALRFKRSKT